MKLFRQLFSIVTACLLIGPALNAMRPQAESAQADPNALLLQAARMQSLQLIEEALTRGADESYSDGENTAMSLLLNAEQNENTRACILRLMRCDEVLQPQEEMAKSAGGNL